MVPTAKLKRLTPEERWRFFLRYVELWSRRKAREAAGLEERQESLRERRRRYYREAYHRNKQEGQS